MDDGVRRDLEIRLSVALAVTPKSTRRDLLDGRSLYSDAARHEIAGRLADAIFQSFSLTRRPDPRSPYDKPAAILACPLIGGD